MGHKFNLAGDKGSMGLCMLAILKLGVSFSADSSRTSITYDPKQLGSREYYARVGTAQEQYLEILKQQLGQEYTRHNTIVAGQLSIDRASSFMTESQKELVIKTRITGIRMMFPLLYFKTVHSILSEAIATHKDFLTEGIQTKIVLRAGKRVLEQMLESDCQDRNKDILQRLVKQQDEMVYIKSRQIDTYLKDIAALEGFYRMIYP